MTHPMPASRPVPNISSTGPASPPKNTAPASGRQLAPLRGVGETLAHQSVHAQSEVRSRGREGRRASKGSRRRGAASRSAFPRRTAARRPEPPERRDCGARSGARLQATRGPSGGHHPGGRCGCRRRRQDWRGGHSHRRPWRHHDAGCRRDGQRGEQPHARWRRCGRRDSPRGRARAAARLRRAAVSRWPRDGRRRLDDGR